MYRKFIHRAKCFIFAFLVLAPGLSTTSSVSSATSESTFPPISIQSRSHIGGSMRAIAIVGNKAYVGVGSRLTILDITNKLHPEVLGMTDPFPDLVENVVVSGNYAYIAATTAGLRIIDISDTSHPVQIGVALGPGLAYGIAIAGTNLFIADPSKGMLWLFDASNPANPVKVWTIKDYYSPLDILVEDNILYLAAGNLEIFDLTNISQPSLLSSVSFDVNSGDILYSIAKNGDYLYAYTRNAGLQIIDVSNPLAPVKNSLFSLGNGYHSYNDIEVINDYAFILHYTGFYVVDIRNPDAPLQAGYLKIPSIPARLDSLSRNCICCRYGQLTVHRHH